MAIVVMPVMIFVGLVIYYARILPFVSKHSQFDRRFLLSAYGLKAIRKYFDLCKEQNRTPWEGYLFWVVFGIGWIVLIVEWASY